jgi:uncharacterized protein (DUF433 family)
LESLLFLTSPIIKLATTMNNNDSSSIYLNRITINPEQCGGRPCIRGTRLRVSDIIDLLAAGASFD